MSCVLLWNCELEPRLYDTGGWCSSASECCSVGDVVVVVMRCEVEVFVAFNQGRRYSACLYIRRRKFVLSLGLSLCTTLWRAESSARMGMIPNEGRTYCPSVTSEPRPDKLSFDGRVISELLLALLKSLILELRSYKCNREFILFLLLFEGCSSVYIKLSKCISLLGVTLLLC